jgi:small subunit ribosomal protein S17
VIVLECNDARCAVHGGLSPRGVQLTGRVVSDKAKKTVIIETDSARYIYKYERFLRSKSRIPAHNPECINAKVGDLVNIAEARRLSKTKSFVVTGIVK